MIGQEGEQHVVAAHPVDEDQAVARVAAQPAACGQQLQGDGLGDVHDPPVGGLDDLRLDEVLQLGGVQVVLVVLERDHDPVGVPVQPERRVHVLRVRRDDDNGLGAREVARHLELQRGNLIAIESAAAELAVAPRGVVLASASAGKRSTDSVRYLYAGIWDGSTARRAPRPPRPPRGNPWGSSTAAMAARCRNSRRLQRDSPANRRLGLRVRASLGSPDALLPSLEACGWASGRPAAGADPAPRRTVGGLRRPDSCRLRQAAPLACAPGRVAAGRPRRGEPSESNGRQAVAAPAARTLSRGAPVGPPGGRDAGPTRQVRRCAGAAARRRRRSTPSRARAPAPPRSAAAAAAARRAGSARAGTTRSPCRPG